MYEKDFVQLIVDNKNIQKYILDILELKSATFYKETTYINGITSDFTLIDENKKEILSIIECKRANINVTDYVRGIGQLFQYEYFFEKDILPKKFIHLTYPQNKIKFRNVLLLPSDFIKNTSMNIGRFKYPVTSTILEINISNHYVRKISNEELLTLEKVEKENLKIISQYYVRDNRLFELYICLKYLAKETIINPKCVLSRKNIELQLEKIQTINNKNWRNVFISLSSLGFINSENKLTETGLIMSNNSYDDFIIEMYRSYLKPYVDEIMSVFVKYNTVEISITNQKLCVYLKEKYNDKEILFLTESKGRYMSSWLNILRDDFGCIGFNPRDSLRRLKYIPNDVKPRVVELLMVLT